MKTPNIFLLLITIASLVSCSDDDDLRSTEEIILGEWIAVDVNYSRSFVTEIDSETIIEESIGEGFDIDYTIAFNDAPNTVNVEGSYSVNSTIVVDNQPITEVIENLSFLANGNWTISRNEVTIENNGESFIGRILLLTDTSLILSVMTETDLSEQGNSLIQIIDSTVTFTR